MKIKTSSWIPKLLMLPSFLILWFFRKPIIETFEKAEYLDLIVAAIIFYFVYWLVVILILWYTVIGRIAELRAGKRLEQEGFRYDYCLSKPASDYSLWIDEIGGKVAIWSKHAPFTVHKVLARDITDLRIEKEVYDEYLQKLALKLNAAGNPIELVLFRAVSTQGQGGILRKSEQAIEVFQTAETTYESLRRAKGQFEEPDEDEIRYNTKKAIEDRKKEAAAKKKRNRIQFAVLLAAFLILLPSTIVLNKKIKEIPRENLGEEVVVKVVEIKRSSNQFGEMGVTVTYDGEQYKLKGAYNSTYSDLKQKMGYTSKIIAWLYEDEMYYSKNSIHLPVDKVYYICLFGTFICFLLLLKQATEI